MTLHRRAIHLRDGVGHPPMVASERPRSGTERPAPGPESAAVDSRRLQLSAMSLGHNGFMTPSPTGLIYTSEPMATRALGAEIRHDPTRLTALLESRLGLAAATLGTLVSVQCEGIGGLDVVLGYGDGDLLVGLEAKFDHEVTESQLAKEQAEVDHLVLVLPTVEDAPSFCPATVPVLSWAEVLDCFIDTRLTAEDIAVAPLQKVTVERMMRKQEMAELLPGWEVRFDRNSSGLPCITIESTPLADGRRLLGQIQVCGRRMPADRSAARLEYHLGIEVYCDDADLPPVNEESTTTHRPVTLVDPAPGWVAHVLLLKEQVLDGRLDELLVKQNAGAGNNEWGKRKMAVVRGHLNDTQWLATGYAGWALGIRSLACELESLPMLCRTAVAILKEWHAAELSAVVS